MKLRSLLAFVAAAALSAEAESAIMQDLAGHLNNNDFAGAANVVANYRRVRGVAPDLLEAMSWMGRAELARKNVPGAEKYAQETYRLSVAETKKHPLGKDPNAPLALALGAAIEVQAEAMALKGERTDAVTYLNGELSKFKATSIQPRIQKNINLLSLEGKPAPALQGAALPAGKTALLFFWAHWCPDCKAEAAILKQLRSEFAAKGLVLIAPTQRYGYVANGDDATPAIENRYIDEVRQRFYPGLIEGPLVINQQNFQIYGVSTTPTLVLVDKKGTVRMYHPGAMSYPELRARIVAALS
ncbi:MAG: TlpA family protein disulfide reductase [Bryobacterales bacterium]|nr:TlpA family protein disulfide reductase [Bryobacterales bacterium]